MEDGGYHSFPKILPKLQSADRRAQSNRGSPLPDGCNPTTWGKSPMPPSETQAPGKPSMPKSSGKPPGKALGQSQDDEEEEAPELREQDRFMPIANVIRIMRKVLPTHAKISDDAKETIQECVSEYISFVTSEANDRCQKEQRKTITAEDVLWAMNKLGFDDYVEPLSMYLHRYREVEGEHRGSIRGEPLPVGLKRSHQDISLYAPPAAPAAYQMGHFHQHQQYQPHQQHQMVYGGGMGGGYYRDGGGSTSSAHVPMSEFDPSYPYYNK